MYQDNQGYVVKKLEKLKFLSVFIIYRNYSSCITGTCTYFIKTNIEVSQLKIGLKSTGKCL